MSAVKADGDTITIYGTKKTVFSIVFTQQEVNDLLNALSFWERAYGKKDPHAMKAMIKLSKKLWKLLQN